MSISSENYHRHHLTIVTVTNKNLARPTPFIFSLPLEHHGADVKMMTVTSLGNCENITGIIWTLWQYQKRYN
jgi:hypothetical protein